jgi:hypothetical protein
MTQWNEMSRDERTKEIVRLIEHEDLSYGDIAFMFGVSRNVIAGLVSRFKDAGGVLINRRMTSKNQFYNDPVKRERALSGTVYLAETDSERAKRKAEINAKRSELAKKLAAERKTLQTVATMPPASRPKVAPPQGLTAMELTNDTCRWPQGEGPYTFCGNPTHRHVNGRAVYCEAHAVVAYKVYEGKGGRRVSKNNGTFLFGSKGEGRTNQDGSWR